MKEELKHAVLVVSRLLGLFHLSRMVMSRRLLILCFHGFEINDEASFRPSLFMRDSTLRRRLATIKRHGFPVLPLGDALDRLAAGKLPANAISITIDDGFYSVLSKAVPLLSQEEMPATLYVTSYYAQKELPVFRLVVQYMFWKTSVASVNLGDVPWGSASPVSLREDRGRDHLLWKVIGYGESQCDEEGRQTICRLLGDRLGVDYSHIVSSRSLSLLNAEELTHLTNCGFIDIQLHTHRHRLPVEDESVARKEIRDNRDFLERVLGRKQKHFCYPSGVWDERQWPWLESEGLDSATTCEPGLNEPTTPRFALFRVLDRDDLTQIEFEAELFGFSEAVRIMSGKRRRSKAVRSLAPD